MARLDHIELPVRDWRASRDWWRDRLGFEVEFEVPERELAAVRDESDLTLFLCQVDILDVPPRFSLTVQVPDVEAAHRSLAGQGVEFNHPPSRVFWGYGAEARDPNGYPVRLWDLKSMKEKGG